MGQPSASGRLSPKRASYFCRSRGGATTMAEVPSPEVTQSQGVSRDPGAARPPEPDATCAPATAQSGSETGFPPGQILGQPPSPTPVQVKTWGNFQLLQLLGRG